MKSSVVTVASILLFFCKANAQTDSGEVGGCGDPLKATLDALQCISESNATCAGAAYNTGEFKKYHNGIDTNTVIDGAAFWKGAFSLLTLDFTYDHLMNAGPNMASIRYREIIKFTNGTNLGLPASSEYPWSYEAIQHEHALVTVDDKCKIKTWDQYGDNEEQDLDDVVGAIMAQLCLKQIAPPEMCVPPTSTNETSAAAEEDSKTADVVTDAVETKVGDGSSSANSWTFLGGLAITGLSAILTFALWL